MALDALIPVQRAIIRAMKADAGVTALVPAARVYQPETPDKPTWPFIRYGEATRLPMRGTGLDGSIISVAVHGFAKGPGNEDAAAIGAAIAALLDGDGRGLTVGLTDASFPATAHVQVTGGRVIRDGAEASAWHAIVDLEVVVSS